MLDASGSTYRILWTLSPCACMIHTSLHPPVDRFLDDPLYALQKTSNTSCKSVDHLAKDKNQSEMKPEEQHYGTDGTGSSSGASADGTQASTYTSAATQESARAFREDGEEVFRQYERRVKDPKDRVYYDWDERRYRPVPPKFCHYVFHDGPSSVWVLTPKLWLLGPPDTPRVISEERETRWANQRKG